jgi:predicted metalloprotease with PDZ domain
LRVDFVFGGSSNYHTKMLHTRFQLSRIFILLFLFSFFLFFESNAIAQTGLRASYKVEIKDKEKQLFHITTEIENIRTPQLQLSLPTWTPGWYVIENYGKNLLRFTVTDGSGKRLQPRMSKKQTWVINTAGINKITVEYDYAATVLGLNQARIGEDFAFFTGTELFLEPIGFRNRPGTLKIIAPEGWRVITPLADGREKNTFTAANYDVLVDAPVLLGNFDLTEFNVGGKPHYLAAYPPNVFSKEKTDRFVKMMSAAFLAERDIFGEFPFDKYVVIYFFRPAESNASGALEHLNSFVAFAPAGANSTPEGLIGTAAHEYFHLWNVKRIRPAEMWPYDYSRENETPSLWVSEGFTNYYSALANYRAGNSTREQFLNTVARVASAIEQEEARSYISPANSSVSTWLGYDTPQAFSISYYAQGQNLGALLDLSIRNDTAGRRGLDDVMRALYLQHFKRNRGFTIPQMISIINRLTGRDYNDFFNKYIWGVEVPDYKTIFGYAGLNLEQKSETIPVFGFFGRFRNDGLTITGIQQGSLASEAGLIAGDVITKIDGQPAISANFGNMAGKKITLSIKRDGKDIEKEFQVGQRTVQNFILTENPSATEGQIKVREAWLRR